MTAGERRLTCRELTEFLADYVAGELAPEARALFAGHLATCPECVAYLQSYRETMRLAKDAYDAEPVPVDVPEQLVRAIVASSTSSPPRGPRRRR